MLGQRVYWRTWNGNLSGTPLRILKLCVKGDFCFVAKGNKPCVNNRELRLMETVPRSWGASYTVHTKLHRRIIEKIYHHHHHRHHCFTAICSASCVSQPVVTWGILYSRGWMRFLNPTTVYQVWTSHCRKRHTGTLQGSRGTEIRVPSPIVHLV